MSCCCAAATATASVPLPLMLPPSCCAPPSHFPLLPPLPRRCHAAANVALLRCRRHRASVKLPLRCHRCAVCRHPALCFHRCELECQVAELEYFIYDVFLGGADFCYLYGFCQLATYSCTQSCITGKTPELVPLFYQSNIF